MTNDEAAAGFKPLHQFILGDGKEFRPPQLLAHYSSIQVVESILSKNQIWFSNPLFMNDLQELRFGMSQGQRLFLEQPRLKVAGGSDARATLLQHAFAHYFQHFDQDGFLDTYVWPAPGSEDTELGVFMGPEVRHGEAEVYARVQA